METKLNVTKTGYDVIKIGLADFQQLSVVNHDKGNVVCHMYLPEYMVTDESEKDANLIADALNTHNTTGYTPSQLLEQKRELVEALRKSTKVISSLKLSMLAHPDCEEGSEFDDMTSTAEEQQDANIDLLTKHSKDV